MLDIMAYEIFLFLGRDGGLHAGNSPFGTRLATFNF